jgi:hypothetical protein
LYLSATRPPVDQAPNNGFMRSAESHYLLAPACSFLLATSWRARVAAVASCVCCRAMRAGRRARPAPLRSLALAVPPPPRALSEHPWLTARRPAQGQSAPVKRPSRNWPRVPLGVTFARKLNTGWRCRYPCPWGMPMGSPATAARVSECAWRLCRLGLDSFLWAAILRPQSDCCAGQAALVVAKTRGPPLTRAYQHQAPRPVPRTGHS